METPQAGQRCGAPCAAPSLPTLRTRLGDRVPSAPRSCPRHTRQAPRLLRSRASSAGERHNDQTNLALSGRDKSREAALNSCHEALQNKRATEASCRERCPRCQGAPGRRQQRPPRSPPPQVPHAAPGAAPGPGLAPPSSTQRDPAGEAEAAAALPARCHPPPAGPGRALTMAKPESSAEVRLEAFSLARLR